MSTFATGGSDDERPSESVEFRRGATVGRYLIVGLIGKGGMGEVYAAYDPELDRKIALKLLRAKASAGVDPSEGRARLLREAQAIARLSDPNVVVVFDVGTFGDRVFLAMEFVDGHTLSYWMEAKARTWREVVATYSAAGRGLASAHRAGVVHRDFKPDNVMIGRDGKIHVMDFGLARSIDDGEANGDGAAGEPTSDGSTAEHEPVPIMSSSPTADNSPAALHATTPAPLPISPPPTATRSPGKASRAETPDTATPVPLLVSTGIVVLPPAHLPAPHAAAPSTGAHPAAAPWGDADTATRDLSKEPGVRAEAASALNTRLTVTGTLMGTPAYMAPEQFEGGKLDARTDQFSFCVAVYEALYGERPFAGKSVEVLSMAVREGRVRPVPAGAGVPGWLRRVVLRGLRRDPAERYPSMDALLAAMAKDPARTRRRWALATTVVAMFAVLGVGFVRAERQQRVRCLGADARLAGIWELPSGSGALSARKQSIRRAFLATGKRYAADSFNVVMSALDRYVTDWNNMHSESCEATNIRGEQSAEVLDLRTGCLQDRFNELRALTGVFSDASGEVVVKAAEAAQALRPIEQCADVAALRAVVRPPDNPAVRRAVADVRTQLADVKALTDAGRYKEALKQSSDTLEGARKTHYKPVVAEALLRSGELLDFSGESSEAEKQYEEAVWTAEAAHHDEVAAEAAAQLISAVGYSRISEGERWGRHASAVLERLGPGYQVLAGWRSNNLALLYENEGKFKESLAAYRDALTLKKSALGDGHFDVAITFMNIAGVLGEMGLNLEAIDNNQRALEIFEKTLGSEHPYVAICLSNAAEFSNTAGAFKEAQRMAERALGLLQSEFDPEHPTLAFPLTALGRSLVAQHHADLALPYLKRALAIREQRDHRAKRLGETQFALAQALWDSVSTREQARKLAQDARAAFQKDANAARQLANLDAWLSSLSGSEHQVSMR